MQPKFYISSSKEKTGCLFALFYFESNTDIYGWHMECKEHYFSAAFFMAENFYASSNPHFYRSVQDDVYGSWKIDYPPIQEEIRCPVPETAHHELERLQSVFVDEWLVFKEDLHDEEEIATYRNNHFPLQEVNIKGKRLNRLEKKEKLWSYNSVGFDLNVVDMLKKYWRLSEKVSMKPH